MAAEFISRNRPSRCIFFFNALRAWSTLLSRTKTCTWSSFSKRLIGPTAKPLGPSAYADRTHSKTVLIPEENAQAGADRVGRDRDNRSNRVQGGPGRGRSFNAHRALKAEIKAMAWLRPCEERLFRFYAPARPTYAALASAAAICARPVSASLSYKYPSVRQGFPVSSWTTNPGPENIPTV